MFLRLTLLSTPPSLTLDTLSISLQKIKDSRSPDCRNPFYPHAAPVKDKAEIVGFSHCIAAPTDTPEPARCNFTPLTISAICAILMHVSCRQHHIFYKESLLMRDTLKRWILPIVLFLGVATLGYGHLKTNVPASPCRQTLVMCSPETQPLCQPNVCQDTDNR